MELVVTPEWAERRSGGLSGHVYGPRRLQGEPRFEQQLNLQQTLKIFLSTANTQTCLLLLKNHTLILSQCMSIFKKNKTTTIQIKNHKNKHFSYPISGFWSIPRIRCNLSMATVCWNLVRPITTQTSNRTRVDWLNIITKDNTVPDIQRPHTFLKPPSL